MKRSLPLLLALASVGVFCGAATYERGIPPIEVPLGQRLPLLSLLPFAGLLAAIAFFPFVARRWWDDNAHKAFVAASFALPLVVLLALHFGRSGLIAVEERLADFVSFLALLGSLYVVAGNIYVQGATTGRPLVNTAVLAFGAVLASLIGTTGASMVLVRPLLRANLQRRRVTHLMIFFIFIVSNCGGLLSPLGDPPLFLGYLAGVPFEWTLRLFPHWAFVNGILLLVFYIWDRTMLARDGAASRANVLPEVLEREPLRLHGAINLVFLVAIMATVAAAGCGTGNAGQPWPYGIREGLMAVLAAGSYFLTNGDIRRKNLFTFRPLVEVAILFAGIFVTMTPALLLLNARGAEFGLHRPWQFFWASGALSSVLDNAPTYLTFASIACGSASIPVDGQYLAQYLRLKEPPADAILAAISCGCVFMGALTYIGNGPNFLVKAIGEEMNVRMPGFFRYLAFSVPVLVPLFALATFAFFRV